MKSGLVGNFCFKICIGSVKAKLYIEDIIDYSNITNINVEAELSEEEALSIYSIEKAMRG